MVQKAYYLATCSIFFCSSKTRFEVVDALVRKWLLKYGGDPKQYKKQTRAFDALAALADKLIRQHVRFIIFNGNVFFNYFSVSEYLITTYIIYCVH